MNDGEEGQRESSAFEPQAQPCPSGRGQLGPTGIYDIRAGSPFRNMRILYLVWGPCLSEAGNT